MDTPETLAERRTRGISAEALIGIGITITALGILGLLLGSAQMMRSATHSGSAWLAVGAVMLVLGLIVTAMSKRGRR